MPEVLKREIVYLWYYFDIQFRQIFWYWVSGMLVGSAISVFLKDRIHGTFMALGHKKLGVLGIAISSVLGIASPLCMYGTIPIAASFSRSGVRDDWLAAFMMSSILLNPQLIFYSAALGATVLTVRILSCFLCGCLAGLCIRFFYKGESFFNFSGFEVPKSRDTDPNLLLRYLKNVWRNIKTTGPYFLLGIVLSAVFPTLCSSGCNDGSFWRKRSLGRTYGSYDRSSPLRLWRRDNPFASTVVIGWDECGKCSFLYADRSGDEDHQSWRIKNCDGNK